MKDPRPTILKRWRRKRSMCRSATNNQRPTNYTKLEDFTLMKAWEIVSLDVVTGNDGTGKKY
jgi:hypothetical protein